MKKLILLLLLLSSCEKDPKITQDPNNKNVYSGTFYVERNGIEWKAQPTARHNYYDKNYFTLGFDSLANGFLQKGFDFTNLPVSYFDTIRKFTNEDGLHFIPLVYFSNIDVDVAYDDWIVLLQDSANNWIKINKFDTITQEVEGVFSITMIRDRGVSPNQPDTMRFRKGRFATKLWK